MNDLAYTLHLDGTSERTSKRDNRGRWKKGCHAWNLGKTWDDMFSKEMQEKLRKHLKEVCKNGSAGKQIYVHRKPVIQLDKYGDRMHWYESSVAAANKTGLDCRNIRHVCNGKRHTCGGFGWRWDERFL